MSTDTLHAIAENDTPQAVHVPKSMHALIVWAVGRFGGGILLAAACAWALSKVYDDHAKQTDRMLTLLESRAKADSELATALTLFKGAIDDIAKEARTAHRTTER
jgi:hypothetical protein